MTLVRWLETASQKTSNEVPDGWLLGSWPETGFDESVRANRQGNLYAGSSRSTTVREPAAVRDDRIVWEFLGPGNRCPPVVREPLGLVVKLDRERNQSLREQGRQGEAVIHTAMIKRVRPIFAVFIESLLNRRLYGGNCQSMTLTSHAAYAASRISSNLRASTKQFGWLQAPATN